MGTDPLDRKRREFEEAAMVDTANRPSDELVGSDSPSLVGAVEHDIREDAFPIKGWDHVRYYVGNARQARRQRRQTRHRTGGGRVAVEVAPAERAGLGLRHPRVLSSVGGTLC